MVFSKNVALSNSELLPKSLAVIVKRRARSTAQHVAGVLDRQPSTVE